MKLSLSPVVDSLAIHRLYVLAVYGSTISRWCPLAIVPLCLPTDLTQTDMSMPPILPQFQPSLVCAKSSSLGPRDSHANLFPFYILNNFLSPPLPPFPMFIHSYHLVSFSCMFFFMYQCEIHHCGQMVSKQNIRDLELCLRAICQLHVDLSMSHPCKTLCTIL